MPSTACTMCRLINSPPVTTHFKITSNHDRKKKESDLKASQNQLCTVIVIRNYINAYTPTHTRTQAMFSDQYPTAILKILQSEFTP